MFKIFRKKTPLIHLSIDVDEKNTLVKVEKYSDNLYIEVNKYQRDIYSHGQSVSPILDITDDLKGLEPTPYKREIAVYKLVDVIEIEYPAVIKHKDESR